MQQAIDKKLPCHVDGCELPVERWYSQGRYAADHSENTFHPWYSEQLTNDASGQPVYVKNREQQQQMMDRMGLRIYERGETKDVENRRKHAKEEQRKAMKKGFEAVLEMRARQ